MNNKKVSARDELLELQRLLYERINGDIDDYIGKTSPYIKKYITEYNKDLTDYQRVSNKAELIRQVIKSHIIYCGDYHTLRQAQRTVIKILREVILHERKIILALEMVHHEDQQHLDDYLLGKEDEQNFLKNIRYNETWNFEWSNYKQLFDFAKKYRIQVAGINCDVKKGERQLKKRDTVASQLIANLHKQDPQALVFVLYGDLHIGQNHIPKMTTKLLHKQRSKNCKSLIIYQNSESLYWLLVSRGLEQKVDVLKIAQDRYCVMNTPPWVKKQTYLNWLEHKNNYQETSDEISDNEDNYDYYHRMWDMADTIATFLHIKKESLDEFNVYTSGDVEFLDFLNTYLKKKLSKNRTAVEFIRNELIYNGTCLLTSEAMIYLSSLSINKSAEKIAQFIHFKASKSEFVLTSNDDARNVYFGRILLETIGYIGSKIINYKRKCELFDDYKHIVKQMSKKRLTGRIRELRQISRLAIEHFDYENLFINKNKKSRKWKNLFSQPPRIL